MAEDFPAVVAWEWECRLPPYFRKRDPDFHHRNARTEKCVRDASKVLLSASQVESTRIHVSVGKDHYVTTPTLWSEVEVPPGSLERMSCVVAYLMTVLRREESTLVAAILTSQCVLEVAVVWYDSARTYWYMWHLAPGFVNLLAGLHPSNFAAKAGPEASSDFLALLVLHQSLDWVRRARISRRDGGDDEEGPRVVLHCDKGVVEERLGLHEGLRDASYPCAERVTPNSAQPYSGWGAAEKGPPQKSKRTSGLAKRPPTHAGAIRRASRLGKAPGGTGGRPVISLPGVPYYSAPEVGKRRIRRYVTAQSVRARATTYPTASKTLRGAHREAIVASFVDILA